MADDGLTEADIQSLWDAGAVHMQNLGNHYANAAVDLHRTAASESGAFDGAVTDIASSFASLRNTLQDHILVKSRDNLVSAGDTLASFAFELVGLDDENGSSVDERAQPLQDHIPGNRPGRIVDPPSSGDEPINENPTPETPYGPV